MNEEPQDGPGYYGREVRHAREHAGKTQQDLADATGYKVPYVSKIENGKTLGSELFASGCDRFFGTSGYFLRMHRRLCERGHPSWFVPYVKLEREAKTICAYSCPMVKGILQIPDYAETVLRASHLTLSAEDLKARVEARMARRQALEGETPAALWMILHESVLRTMVGGTAVMSRQLGQLLEDAESPQITIQILPFKAGAPAWLPPFTLLTQGEGPTFLYEEGQQHGRLDDSAAAVEHAQAIYDRLRADALSPAQSADLIHRTLEAYTHEHSPGPRPRDMGEVEPQRRKRRRLRRVGPRLYGLRRRPHT